MDRLTGEFKGASMFATAADARIHSRLRQYEDTGLTPDEIADLRAENAGLRKLYQSMRDAMCKIERLSADMCLTESEFREAMNRAALDAQEGVKHA